MDSGGTHAQSFDIGPVLFDIPLGDSLIIGAFLVGLVDDFVINVSEVLNETHLIAPELQIAAQHVKDAEGTGVSDMDEVVHGGTAGVHLHLSLLMRDKFFLLPGQGVEYFHRYLLHFSVIC